MKHIISILAMTVTLSILPLSTEGHGSVFTLDIDESGDVRALSDGLLVMRYLFGFSGPTLTENAISSEAKRLDAELIKAHLDEHREQLDIDLDGKQRPLTDGLLILRYLFGFSETTLTAGAIDELAVRRSSAELRAYFETVLDTDGDGIVDADDDRKPLLTLLGNSVVEVSLGSAYVDAGAIATDPEDGDLTSEIVVFGLSETDLQTPGIYRVRFELTDSGGNTVFAERTVTVTSPAQTLGVLKTGTSAQDPQALLEEGFAIIGAFDAGINYNSCENDQGQGCPNMGWSVVTDPDRGSVLEVGHSSSAVHAGLYIKTGDTGPMNLSEFAGGIIQFDVKVISGDPSMTMKIDCVYPCTSNDYRLADASQGVWVTYEVPVDTLTDRGLDLCQIDTGLVIWAAEFTDTTFQLDSVQWMANETGPLNSPDCPEPLPAPGADWVNPNLASGYEAPTGYQDLSLAWSDEFEGTALDAAYWNAEVNGDGGGNNELQYYRSQNAYLREGLLVIEARREDFGGKNYTSARLTTEDKFEFKYGRIDIRAALPTGQGLWPALWMLGANFKEVGWPRSGEIDIMELVGQDNDRVFGTVHWDNNGSKAQYPTSGGGFEVSNGETFNNQYHVFSLAWSESGLEWFVDGERYQTFDINNGAGLDAFRKAFFLIFNIAVGGNLPGSPNGDTEFPQYMHVDYVRVYQPTP